MNPDTRQLELIDHKNLGVQRYTATLKEGPVPRLEVSLAEIAGTRRVSEPHKAGWTTFAIGETVEVRWDRDGKPFYRDVRVKNIHADGLLLSAPNLNASFFAGQEIAVKGEKCRVERIISKGMYVRGAS